MESLGQILLSLTSRMDDCAVGNHDRDAVKLVVMQMFCEASYETSRLYLWSRGWMMREV